MASFAYPDSDHNRFQRVMATVAPEPPVLVRDQAFEHLYRRYVEDVYRYALALLRNSADAEDVTQTTFLNAYRAWLRGDEIKKPQNWLITIAHNVARSRYARASRRVKEVPLDDHLDQLAIPEDERPNVEGVLRALGRLPFNQRAALIMRELEGRSYAEIADTIGVSVPAVETLIFRARKSLRLRASALRVLAGVPLPNSLAQLFEGGGAVAAGGGALAGTGFVVKAAIALLAGAVATGIGGNGIRPSAALADAATGAPASTLLTASHASLPPRSVNGVPAAVAADTVRAIASATRSGHAYAHAAAAPALGHRPVTNGSSTSSGAAAPQGTDLTSAATTTISHTVGEVVPTVTSALPEVAASLPAVPELPKLP
jgi:RNA polymerase sigma factor (sigma-70 family)